MLRGRVLGIALTLIMLIAGFGCVQIAEENDEIAGYIAIWLADEGSGDVLLDSSGNDNHGSVANTEWEEGKNGYALRITEASIVSIPYSDDFAAMAEEFTIEAWVHMFSYKPWDRIFEAGAINLRVEESGKLATQVHVNGNSMISTSKDVIPLNTWTHVAVTYSKKEAEPAVRLYINGVEVSEYDSLAKPAAIDPIAPGTTMFIGRSALSGNNRYIDGLVDEVKISSAVRDYLERR